VSNHPVALCQHGRQYHWWSTLWQLHTLTVTQLYSDLTLPMSKGPC